MQWFNRCIYCRMITTLRLINTSITSHTYNLVILVRTFFFHFLLLPWQVEVLGPDTEPVPQQQSMPLQWQHRILNLLYQKQIAGEIFYIAYLSNCLSLFFKNWYMVDVQYHKFWAYNIVGFIIFKCYTPLRVIIEYWVYSNIKSNIPVGFLFSTKWLVLLNPLPHLYFSFSPHY